MQRLTKYPLLLDNIAKYTGTIYSLKLKSLGRKKKKRTKFCHSILVPRGFRIVEQNFLVRFNPVSRIFDIVDSIIESSTGFVNLDHGPNLANHLFL